MVESDLNPLENRQVSRRVTTMLCCWIRMLLSWRSCCGVKLRQLELVRSCWNLAKLPKLQLKPVLVKAKHFGHGQKLMEIIAQVKSEFYWCFLKGLGCFFLFRIFVGEINPSRSIQIMRSSRIAAAERVEEFSSLDLSRCAWAAAMLEVLGWLKPGNPGRMAMAMASG